MRLIYFDVDTLRPDHLGCYGYRRPTSPVIDALAARGVRFDNVHASDTPCLPSRSALSTGQFGIRNGAVNHGGPATDLFPEGPARGFRTAAAAHSWMAPLRDLGMWTTSISTFAERHSAYHFDAGFNECVNLGTRGLETADQVEAAAREWLVRNAHRRGLVPPRPPLGPPHPLPHAGLLRRPVRRRPPAWMADRGGAGRPLAAPRPPLGPGAGRLRPP